MIPTESEIANQSLLAWDNWLNTAPGLYVLNWEQAQFNRAVDDAFGFDALQIGFPQVGCLNENRISNRWLMQLPSQPTVDLSNNHGVHTICQGSIYDLPFATESMDLIALPHVLEFTANPHEALREVHRVLRPEGRIGISGFNPMSLWGMRQYYGKLFNRPFLPKEGQFISHLRIKDWLRLLNYAIDRGKFGCYSLPLQNHRTMTTPSLLDKVGDRWWPFLGSVFMLSAIKRTPRMKLVGKILSRRPSLSQTLAPVTQSKTTQQTNSTND